jgi:hypothetical protein
MGTERPFQNSHARSRRPCFQPWRRLRNGGKKAEVEISLGLKTTTISLKKGERVVWETAGCRLKQRTSNGVPFWESDGMGMLVVTDQRVIFRADTGAMWSKPVTKLLSANHEYIGDQGICVLWIDGQQKPVAFGKVLAMRTVSIGDVTFSIELTSHDLREVLQSRCGG